MNSLAITFLALALASLVYAVLGSGRRPKGLPLGPPTLPILGNLHQLPVERTYLKFGEWAKEYGEMYSVMVASKATIVISSRRLVKELMDKKNSISGFRPTSYVLNNLIYNGDYLLLMNSDDVRFRTGRRFIHQHFMESMTEKEHLPVINGEATQLLRDLCASPDSFSRHARRYANSFIMSVTYGVRTPSLETPHLIKIEHIIETLTKLILPGKLPPVDIFPFLRWLPESLFRNWVSTCNEIRRETDGLYAELLNAVVTRRKVEGSRDSFADKLIDDQKKLGLSWHELVYMTGIMIDAGSDTTSSGIMTFIQMMVKYPEIRKNAQDQIDQVVGDDRTPVWDDYDRLPIVTALMKELQRFRPLVPIAFPHRLSEEVVLDGKILPKNATIVVNIPALHHDPKKFPYPNTFNPENFAGMTGVAATYANAADYEARDHYGYGFGRRLCPGIHVAERSLFVTFSKLLWAFDFGPATDSAGNKLPCDISFETGFTDGAIIQPKDFPCSIMPRSAKRRETIMREFEDVQRDIFTKFDLPKGEVA